MVCLILGPKLLRLGKHEHQKFNYHQRIRESRISFFFFSFACILEVISFKVTFTDLETFYGDVASWSLRFVGTMTKTLIFCFSVN